VHAADQVYAACDGAYSAGLHLMLMCFFSPLLLLPAV
jgi:hypothetical protein